MAVFTSLNGEPNNCSLTNSSLFIVYLLWWRMSIVSLAVLTLSSTNITWLLFVYIAKMLLSVHLHIILMRSLAALTHVIFQFLMHSLFLPQQHQLLHFLLFIIALYNSLQYFLSAYTLPFFYLTTGHSSFAHHIDIWFHYQFFRINIIYSRVQYPPTLRLWIQSTSFFNSNHIISLCSHFLYYISTIHYFFPVSIIISRKTYPTYCNADKNRAV